MARLARVVVPGMAHHLVHRGNGRKNVFVDPSDRQTYLALLRHHAEIYGTEIWAYCLMTNHIHLVAVPGRSYSLARTLGLTQMRYAQWFNPRYETSGHLWANRFYSTPLAEDHLWAAVRYVELNPVRAGIVERAQDYPWSSARVHALGHSDPILAASSPFSGAVADWAEWLVADPDGESTEIVRRSTRTGRPCGDRAFVQALEAATGRRLAPQRRGRKGKSGTVHSIRALPFRAD